MYKLYFTCLEGDVYNTCLICSMVDVSELCMLAISLHRLNGVCKHKITVQDSQGENVLSLLFSE